VILQSKILALLNEILGQNARLRKGGNEASYFCCFCNHYKRKLEFDLETGQWSCWVCHAKGSYLGSFLSKIKAPPQYRVRLFEITKDVRFRRKQRKTVTETLSLPNEFITLAEPSNDPSYKNAIFYLKKRNVGMDDICRYNIGYCNRGEYANCIIIPSYDSEGKLNYFSSRHFYYSYIKYKNPPVSKNVIGFESFINFKEPVTLVEGAFDAVTVRKNAGPLFGTTIPRRLLEALVLNHPPRINVVMDSDAIKQALKMVQKLWEWGLLVHLVKLDDKDPSELGFEKMSELIDKSNPADFQEVIYRRLME
jgi:hypothetical protein